MSQYRSQAINNTRRITQNIMDKTNDLNATQEDPARAIFSSINRPEDLRFRHDESRRTVDVPFSSNISRISGSIDHNKLDQSNKKIMGYLNQKSRMKSKQYERFVNRNQRTKRIDKQLKKGQKQQKQQQQQQQQQQYALKQIQFGQFSHFAVKTQRQVIQRKNIIQKVIKQACLSFKAKINEISALSGKLETHKQLYKELNFDTQQSARMFIINPNQYYKSYYKRISIVWIINDFIKKYKQMSQHLITDGKLLKISNLSIQKSFKQDSTLYIPIKQKQYTYAKIHVGQGGLVKVNLAQLFNEKFFTRSDLQLMTNNIIQEIKTMVILFLQYKGIILQQSQDIVQKLKIAIK